MAIGFINVKSNSRNEFIDITEEVQKQIAEAGVAKGLVILYVPHTTAAITINEGADPSVRYDIINTLSRLIPHVAGYRHMEGNSDAHLKSSIIGVSVMVPINEGSLVLGTWQSIYFCEFDGPRHRRVELKIISG